MVPGVVLIGAVGDFGAARAAPFIVVRVVVNSVSCQLVVVSGGITGHCPVAVFVERVIFVRLIRMIGGG